VFQHLRRCIQTVIDRRFYRRKYDAARTLATFSATLRHEVDLDQLRENLVTVVEETMQPTFVSLWLRVNVTSPTYSGTTATLSYDLLDHFVKLDAGSQSKDLSI
jgi:hypothetical protein